ncbi:MAG: 2-C-methyl-D-erythritol 4-phosphate cytidylyltransferase [Clostridia bacterium]|nr:2-C-methyl-D-erythritol 4-phosphate cytidylyltransferase [Clostridia bacterium]
MGIFSRIGNFFKSQRSGDLSAIILCAGNSTRFSSNNESKQLVDIDGKLVIQYTIEAFQRCKFVREIILVVRKEDASSYNSLVCNNGYDKVECIVIGGETRQISAMKGFKHISDKSKYVSIHDGARCLVTEEIICDVYNAAKKYSAATAATMATDTVKLSDNEGFISKTLNRENLWNVQTPQIFEKNLYKLSIENAKANGIAVTDDCMLVEAYGRKVKLVESDKKNIKITVKDDIFIAEGIIKQRKNN